MPRELVRGLVAAAIVLALMMLGVRTMVSRMSEHARVARESESESEGMSESESESESESVSESERERETDSHPPVPAPVPVRDPSPPPSPSTTTATDPPLHRGTLDAVAVRGVVREALPEIRFCFEWELNAHPDLAGRVTMQFTIAEDGTVSDASVLEDALHDDTVTRCFTHVMSHLRFPPPEGGSVLVNYPFSLSNSPEAQRPEGI